MIEALYDHLSENPASATIRMAPSATQNLPTILDGVLIQVIPNRQGGTNDVRTVSQYTFDF